MCHVTLFAKGELMLTNCTATVNTELPSYILALINVS